MKAENRERRRILLAVSGGIAAYKVPELVRLLQKSGFEVRCMLTESAREFVSGLVLETLTGHRAVSRLWGLNSEELPSGTEHIDWARWPDLVLVAPATAHTLARIAHGLADDFVSTVLLATRAKILLAPAMNTAMWENAATQANLELLRSRGHEVLPPDSGRLACGEEGAGKLPELEAIVRKAEQTLELETGLEREPSRQRTVDGSTEGSAWSGRRILITAGPTITRIDAVRYITNPSTGLMGKALAEEALAQGAVVHLVLGIDKGVVRPVARNADEARRLEIIEVETAGQMLDAALERLDNCEGVIATAAVMDYEVTAPANGKLKRSKADTTLHLHAAPDVLATLRERARGNQWFVGFAAETDAVQANAIAKWKRKRLDFLFANPVAATGDRLSSGFGTTTNSGYWISTARPPLPALSPASDVATEPCVESWTLASKAEIARRILAAVSAAKTKPADARPCRCPPEPKLPPCFDSDAPRS